jgi:hypothetical protein
MSDTKQIVLFPKGSLDPKIAVKLEAAGVIGIEVENPQDVVMLTPSVSALTGDLVVKAFIDAISGVGSTSEREKFAVSVMRQIQSKKTP